MGASQYGPVSRSPGVARYLAFVAACALQLLFILAFVELGRDHGTANVPEPAVTAVLLPPGQEAPASTPTAPTATRRMPSPLSIQPVPRVLPAPEINFPPTQARSASQSRKARADWARAAHLAAAQVVAEQTLARRRRQASGEMPWPQTEPGPRTPSLPWSHQPLTRWFDFDPATLVTSLNLGRHCELVFFVILPGFGCILGHIDSGAGGHFDANFDPTSLEPPPLELPGPGLPTPPDLQPWKETTAR